MTPTKNIQLTNELGESRPTIVAALTKADGSVIDPDSLGGSTGPITTAQLADNAVTEAKIKDGSVSRLKLTADCVGEGNILPNSIATNMVKDGAITKAKIAAGVIPTVPGAATATALGLVKKAATLANAANAAGDAPTKAEFDALVLKFNNLLAQLKAAGIMS